MDRQIFQLNGGVPVAPALTDLFAFQKADGSVEAQPGTIASLLALLGIASIYSASITQAGTAAPSPFPLINTTGETITMIRTGVGYSRLSSTNGPWDLSKTVILYDGVGSGGYTDPKHFTHQITAPNTINFGAFRISDQTPEDDWKMNILVIVFV